MTKNFRICLLALSFLWVGAVQAVAAGNDTVVLQDGTLMKGMILEQTEERVKVQTDEGVVRVLDMTEVAKISRGAAPAPVVQTQPLPLPSSSIRKDPGVAFHMSCYLPGAGQFYSDQPGKGFLQLGLFIGGIVFAIAEAPKEDLYEVYDGDGFYLGTEVEYQGDESACAIGLLVSASAWLWSVLDAPGCAEQWNRNHGLSLYDDPLKNQALTVEPVLFGGKTKDASGIQVAYRF